MDSSDPSATFTNTFVLGNNYYQGVYLGRLCFTGQKLRESNAEDVFSCDNNHPSQCVLSYLDDGDFVLGDLDHVLGDLEYFSTYLGWSHT